MKGDLGSESAEESRNHCNVVSHKIVLLTLCLSTYHYSVLLFGLTLGHGLNVNLFGMCWQVTSEPTSPSMKSPNSETQNIKLMRDSILPRTLGKSKPRKVRYGSIH